MAGNIYFCIRRGIILTHYFVDSQCCKKDCKRLDFLPCACKSCGMVFCGEHATEHALVCEKLPVAGERLAETEAVICAQAGCGQRCLAPVECVRCGGRYCVPHRHGPQCVPLDPDQQRLARQAVEVPRQQFAQAKARAEREVKCLIILLDTQFFAYRWNGRAR